jgi:hypothetical protein
LRQLLGVVIFRTTYARDGQFRQLFRLGSSLGSIGLGLGGRGVCSAEPFLIILIPLDRISADKIAEIWLGAKNFVCRKCFWNSFGRQTCRNFDIVPKTLSVENYCPPKILSAEFWSDKLSASHSFLYESDSSIRCTRQDKNIIIDFSSSSESFKKVHKYC